MVEPMELKLKQSSQCRLVTKQSTVPIWNRRMECKLVMKIEIDAIDSKLYAKKTLQSTSKTISQKVTWLVVDSILQHGRDQHVEVSNLIRARRCSTLELRAIWRKGESGTIWEEGHNAAACHQSSRWLSQPRRNAWWLVWFSRRERSLLY